MSASLAGAEVGAPSSLGKQRGDAAHNTISGGDVAVISPLWRGAFAFCIASIAAAAISVCAPLATAVFGLMFFGVLHNVLEIRCLANQYAEPLVGRRGWGMFGLLMGLLLVIAGCRYGIMVGKVSQPTGWLIELGASYGAISLVVISVLARRSYVALVAVSVLLGSAAAASYVYPNWHFLVLTHLHNLLPAAFVMDWAFRRRRVGTGEKGLVAMGAAQVLWMVVLPLLILCGAADRLIAGNLERWTASMVAGGAERAALLLMPPQWLTSPAVLGRVLAVFAYLQLMHYFVWIGFLPAAGYLNSPETSGQSAASLLGRATRSRIYMGAGLALAAAVFLVFLIDYWTGRSLYGAITTFHVYLELPIVLLLVAAAASKHSRVME